MSVRTGLGCMRLSTDAARDEARSVATIRAAFEGGVRVFDTAHAYGLGEGDEGHNERLLGRVLRELGGGRRPGDARVVTKCGMRREATAWIPDGRAGFIADGAAASARALGEPPDVLLLHAPDLRTSLTTSVRALEHAKLSGLASAIGLSNVTRKQLDEASAVARIDVVEVALGAYDDAAIRGGVVAWCLAHDVEVLAHSPLGGPARAHRLAGDRTLRAIGARTSATPHEVVLAYLLALHPTITPLVGARTAAAVASALASERLALDDEAFAALDERFAGLAMLRRPRPAPPATSAREVVVLMGIPGAGKSSAAAAYVERGHARLNRDTLGGTLASVARRLDDLLREGAQAVVLDNTYVSRVSRSEVVRVAHAHGARVTCVFFDTPAHEAQVNAVARMLDAHGELLGPVEMKQRAKKDPTALAPHAITRMLRDLEPPAEDEGFSTIERVPFSRRHPPGHGTKGAAIALELLARRRGDELVLRDDARAIIEAHRDGAAHVMVFGWLPDASQELASRAAVTVREALGAELALCLHAAGPALCWCRPPLPGLWLTFARAHRLDPRVSVVVGARPSHAAMARALGMIHRDFSQ